MTTRDDDDYDRYSDDDPPNDDGRPDEADSPDDRWDHLDCDRPVDEVVDHYIPHPVGDLLTVDDLLALPEPEWLIAPDLLPKEGLVGLYGPPGSGKSFVALDWALSIASGRDWLGRYPVRQSPVVYVAAEGGRGIQKRVLAWVRHHKAYGLLGSYFLLKPLQFHEAGAVEAFLRDLGEINPGLLIIDTLSRSFGGGDENASADMSKFLDAVMTIGTAKRMTTLVVHHTNATGKRERGHTSFRGAADAMFECQAEHEGGKLLAIQLLNNKQKDAGDAAPIWLRPTLEPIAGSLYLDWMEAPEAAPATSGGRAPISIPAMLAVLAAADNGLTWGEWRIAVGMDRNRFNKRLTKLQSESIIHKDETTGRWVVTGHTQDLVDV